MDGGVLRTALLTLNWTVGNCRTTTSHRSSSGARVAGKILLRLNLNHQRPLTIPSFDSDIIFVTGAYVYRSEESRSSPSRILARVQRSTTAARSVVRVFPQK